ncbi:O-antigen ligase family protein [Citromicrobium bathyomarinum]|uniref:O-antigen ligase family protein n=1 Tax=Citromicrobium bathyomarinum TaxID=72174 RepID=UPI003159CFD8
MVWHNRELRASAGLALMLVIAISFGGGGRSAPLANLIVQLAALLALAVSIANLREFLLAVPRGLVVLIAISMAIPMVQSIPLPPTVWTALPGRELVSESLALIDASGTWMPFSVDPSLSLLAFIGLVAPLTVLVLAAPYRAQQIRAGLLALLGGALVCLFIGSVQFASGGDALDFYAGGSVNRLAGTFANHNTAGIFFVILLCLLVSAQKDWFPSPFVNLGPRIALGLVFLIGVILSQSRSSIALLLFPALVLVWRLYCAHTLMKWSRRSLALASGSGALAIAMVALLTFSGGRGAQSIERFESLEDLRPAIWADGLVSADRFWPVGSGMGTFDDVFQLDESLEHVTPRRAGRAHNDYLEIAIESGVLGLAMVLGWVAYLGSLTWRSLRSRSDLLPLGASAGLACIALQSVVDYPLRNQAMLCVAAFLVVILVSGVSDVRGKGASRG